MELLQQTMKARLLTHYFPCTFTTSRPINLVCCAVLLLLLASGCTLSPPQPEQRPTAQNQAESAATGGQDAELIALVATMQPGETSTFEGMSVESGQAFSAASGRLCKYITLGDPNNPDKTRSRLACRDSNGWFFATDIFSSEARGD